MPSEEKEKQEKRSLLSTNDNFRKIIITYDDIKQKTDEQGIPYILCKRTIHDMSFGRQEVTADIKCSSVHTTLGMKRLAWPNSEMKSVTTKVTIGLKCMERTITSSSLRKDCHRTS